MKEKGKGALLVVEASRLSGIFTERDALFRVIAAGRDPATTLLADVMTPQPQTMHPDEPFVKALRVMHKRGFRHLPVVEHGRPLGVVSARDALDDDLYELRVELETAGRRAGLIAAEVTLGSRSGRDQARHAHWHARPLQSFDPVLDLPVGHRQAGPQPDVFGPRPDDETLDEATLLAQIPEDEPVARPVAPPDRLDACEWRL